MFQIDTTGFFLYRPKEFVECEDPVDHKGNKTAKEETGFGCVKVRPFLCSFKSKIRSAKETRGKRQNVSSSL